MFTAEVKSDKHEDICILVKVQNHSFNYICECGEARRLGVKDCQNTNAIFISHTHIDHFVNFDTILRHQLGIQRTVTVVGPKGIVDNVRNRIISYCWNLIEKNSITYEIREILSNTEYRSVKLRPPLWEIEEERCISSEQIFEENNFKVEFEILDHKTASISYLFRANDKVNVELPKDLKGGKWVGELKSAYEKNEGEKLLLVNNQYIKCKDPFYLIKKQRGKTLGIIMDHAANEANHYLIKKRFLMCDKVFIESFYKDEDIQNAKKNFHSSASESGRIMKLAKVKEAIPVHFSRKYDESDLEQLICQFKEAYE